MNDFLSSLVNDPTVTAIGMAVGGALVGLWLVAAWWTYADISRRTTVELARLTAVGWVLVSTPALLPLSLATYLLARPQRTVAEARAQNLFEALAPSLDDGRCPACGAIANPEWQRCPTCTAWLASACAACGRWSPIELDTCPWCAEDKAAVPPRVAVAVGPGQAPASAPAEVPLFTPDVDDDTGAWSPSLASGEARPSAAFSTHRFGATGRAAPRPSNRGARDPRRVRDADRVAGSDRLGIG